MTATVRYLVACLGTKIRGGGGGGRGDGNQAALHILYRTYMIMLHPMPAAGCVRYIAHQPFTDLLRSRNGSTLLLCICIFYVLISPNNKSKKIQLVITKKNLRRVKFGKESKTDARLGSDTAVMCA